MACNQSFARLCICIIVFNSSGPQPTTVEFACGEGAGVKPRCQCFSGTKPNPNPLMQEQMNEVYDWVGRFPLALPNRKKTLSYESNIEAEAPGLNTGAIKLQGGPYCIRRPRVRQWDWVNPACNRTPYTRLALELGICKWNSSLRPLIWAEGRTF